MLRTWTQVFGGTTVVETSPSWIETVLIAIIEYNIVQIQHDESEIHRNSPWTKPHSDDSTKISESSSSSRESPESVKPWEKSDFSVFYEFESWPQRPKPEI